MYVNVFINTRCLITPTSTVKLKYVYARHNYANMHHTCMLQIGCRIWKKGVEGGGSAVIRSQMGPE